MTSQCETGCFVLNSNNGYSILSHWMMCNINNNIAYHTHPVVLSLVSFFLLSNPYGRYNAGA